MGKYLEFHLEREFFVINEVGWLVLAYLNIK
jgi:hypothetical protein